MMLFSDEWVSTYMELLNTNPAYEEAAKTWEGDFIFIGRNSETNDIVGAAYFDLWHGKCRSANTIQDIETMDGITPEFIYDGKISNWKLVLEKKLDPIQGLMTGKFKLTGNMSKVMRAVKAAQELVNTTMQLETEFPE